MSTERPLVVADVIDLDEAVEDAEQQRAEAEKIAVRFDRVADDIAAFAAFVRSHPHLAKHMQYADLQYGNKANAYVNDAATIADFARAGARAGHSVTKRPGGPDDQYFGVEIGFGWMRLYVYTARDAVCERVVTGTREVVEEVPDPDAPKVMVTRTEEIVEYRCGPLLGGGSDG